MRLHIVQESVKCWRLQRIFTREFEIYLLSDGIDNVGEIWEMSLQETRMIKGTHLCLDGYADVSELHASIHEGEYSAGEFFRDVIIMMTG
jgi:hypothetical protein